MEHLTILPKRGRVFFRVFLHSIYTNWLQRSTGSLMFNIISPLSVGPHRLHFSIGGQQSADDLSNWRCTEHSGQSVDTMDAQNELLVILTALQTLTLSALLHSQACLYLRFRLMKMIENRDWERPENVAVASSDISAFITIYRVDYVVLADR